MVCDLNYRLGEWALECLENDGETTLQRIRDRQGCEGKQAICLYAVRRRRRRISSSSVVSFSCYILDSLIKCKVYLENRVSDFLRLIFLLYNLSVE